MKKVTIYDLLKINFQYGWNGGRCKVCEQIVSGEIEVLTTMGSGRHFWCHFKIPPSDHSVPVPKSVFERIVHISPERAQYFYWIEEQDRYLDD